MEPVPTVLAFALQEERGFGAVFCEWRPRVGDGEAGARERDEFVFAALGSEADTRGKDGYREVTAAEARHIVAHWMRHSMAYGRPLSGSGPSRPGSPALRTRAPGACSCWWSARKWP